MAIASLVLGILALVTCWIPVIGNIAAFILGLIGLILAIIAMKRAEKKGTAIAGLVLSIIALVVSVIMMVVLGIGAATVMNDPALQQQLQSAMEEAVKAAESALPTVTP